MNDFKKEELNQLMEACTNWFECPDEGIMEEAQNLVGKLQSMIDNYCEHEYEEESVELHAKQCCKCQEVKVL